jgi:hypothetical protein
LSGLPRAVLSMSTKAVEWFRFSLSPRNKNGICPVFFTGLLRK